MGFEEPDHILRRRDCFVAHWLPDLLSRQLESSETSLTPLEGCYGLARRQDCSREKLGTALIQPVISPDALLTRKSDIDKAFQQSNLSLLC
jgi:hypothetical protein